MSHITADSVDIEIFEGLNDADLAELDDRFAMASFRKGELIYSPYDRGEALFVIESGRVRLFRSASDGRQVTLAMLDPGSSFGQISVLDDLMHDAYAETMADSVVRVLRVSDLERAIAQHPRVALNLMRSLSERLRTAEDQIESPGAAEDLRLSGRSPAPLHYTASQNFGKRRLQWLKPEPCGSRAVWRRCSRAA